jgi:hypothetical protein
MCRKGTRAIHAQLPGWNTRTKITRTEITRTKITRTKKSPDG